MTINLIKFGWNHNLFNTVTEGPGMSVHIAEVTFVWISVSKAPAKRLNIFVQHGIC